MAHERELKPSLGRARAFALWCASAALAMVALRCAAFAGTDEPSGNQDAGGAADGGASSSTDGSALPDGASGDGAIGVDAGGAALDGGFCSQWVGPGIFCDDFDEGAFPRSDFGKRGTGTVARVDGGTSPPYALSVTSSGGAIDAELSTSATMVMKTPASLRMHASVRIDAPPQDAELLLAQLQDGKGGLYTFFLVFDHPSTVALWLSDATNQGPICTVINYAPGQWFTVDVTYDFAQNVTSGQLYTNKQCPVPATNMGAPTITQTASYAWTAILGIDYVKTGGATILIDDYFVDFK
jgi:hypothetical protein